MVTALHVALLFLVCSSSILVLIFAAEALVGCAAINAPARPGHAPFRGTVCVLVPAHDEEAGIAATLRDIRAQLKATDRVVVIADNCSDNTATIAASEGAEVTVRSETRKRGKGYALDWGMSWIAAAPPDVIVVVDADCRLGEDAIPLLSSTAAAQNRPVQALYLMASPALSSVGQKVAGFAWLLKNRVRPLGLKRAHLPCQLMGTGMAFPWAVLRSADLANGDLVEDMRLGLDLAEAGSAPMFLPRAIVSSTFPSTDAGASAQRKRWEQGHLRSIATIAIPRLWTSLIRRNWPLAAMCLDLMIPPVSLFVLIVGGLFVTSAIAALMGLSMAALLISTVSVALLTASIMAAWFAVGRDILPVASLLGIPAYVTRKLPIYARLVSGRSSKDWVRSDRT